MNKINEKTASLGGNHSSPIYDEECRMLLQNEYKHWKCKKHKSLKKELTKIEKTHNRKIGLLTDISRDPRQCVFQWANKIRYVRRNVSHLLPSLQNWVVQKIWFLSSSIEGGMLSYPEILENCNKKIQDITDMLPLLQSDYDNLVLSEQVKDEICYREIKLGSFYEYLGSFFERDVSVINCPCHGTNLVPTSIVLDTLDQLQTRFSLVLYWKLSDIFKKYTSSIYDRGTKLIKYFTSLRPIMGNDLYALLSTWESLLIGYVILDEADVKFEDLYLSQRADIDEIYHKYRLELDEKLLFPTSRTDEEVCMVLELIGIIKQFGYPVLKADELLKPLIEYGTKSDHLINADILKKVMGITKRDFCINYRKKKGLYPVVTYYPQLLREIFEFNQDVPEKVMQSYYEWDSLVFGKTLDYDYTPDMVELIKDSACCRPVKDWKKGYDRCGFNIRYGKDVQFEEDEEVFEPRVIMRFIKGEEDEVEKLVKERENGIYNDNDKVAFISGKECELKIGSGRGFTIQTYEQRLIQSSNEFNTGKKVFPYVPEQSMTDSEVIEVRRILAQVKKTLKTHELFVLDLKKWCLHWRWESVIELGRMYDQLFGFKGLYTNAHTYFINCHVFANLRLCPPDFDESGNPIEGNFYTNKFIGGMEGMHQKRWTHITISAIKLAAEMTNVVVQIIGQGDNQIVLLECNDEDNPAQIRYAFRDNLSLVIQGIGHELKEKETWVSRQLHEYGKLRIYKGRHISQGSKRKISPDTNDILHSIPSMISTINTCTEGLARLDFSADVAFILNCLLVFHFLFRKGLLKNTDDMVDKQCSLFFPIDFGGLPLSNYNNHLIRGHPDQVTVWLGILLVIKRMYPNIFRKITTIWQTIEESPLSDERFLRLIEDNYGLRVNSLPSIEQVIKDDGMKFIKSDHVTNPMITMLRDENNLVNEMDLVVILRSMKPFFAPIAHSIYVNSNVGLLKRFPSRFTSVKTIEKMIIEETERSLIAEINIQNRRYITEFRRRVKQAPFGDSAKYLDDFNCPTTLADTLRRDGWETDIVGLTKPTIQHQFSIISVDDCPEGLINPSVIIKTSEQMQLNPRCVTSTYAQFSPFIGSVTDQKVNKPVIEFAQKTGHKKAYLELGYIRSWSELLTMPGIYSLVSTLLEEKELNINFPEELENKEDLFRKVKSGNIGHRFLTEVEKPYAMVNSLPGFTTHFHQSSNMMSNLSTGGKDFNIFYQELYVVNMQIIRLVGEITNNVSSMYMALPSCDGCLKEITDLKFDLDPIGLGYTPLPIEQAGDISSNIPQDIPSQMAFVIGLDLAKNIDINFKIHHRNDPMDKINETFKSNISINDFRDLPLVEMISIACLYSSHFKEISQCKNDHLLSNTLDLSFSYISELIMNSGRITELLVEMGIPVSEHTQLTQFKKLSPLILRGFIRLYRNKPIEFLKIALKYNFKDEKIDQSHLLKELIKISGDKVAQNYFYQGHDNFARRRLHLVNCIIPSKTNVITQWRSHNRLPVTVEINRVKIEPKYNIKYAILESHAYHHMRSVNRGDIRIKELCFFARPLGIISSAANKYLELLVVLGIANLKNHINNILCLAEGSGGTLSILGALFPNTTMTYNTWMSDEIDNRDDITNTLPPAVVASCQIDRLTKSNLSCGETNILKPMFSVKLVNTINTNKVDFITMDAESVNHSTNLHFLLHLKQFILQDSVKLVIMKMFHECDLEKLITEHTCLNKYKFYLFKPISSNPIGTEILLILIRGDIQIDNEKMMTKNWTLCKKYIDKDQGMTLQQVKTYIQLSLIISKKLLSIGLDEMYICKDKYDWGNYGDTCSLHCINMLSHIIDSIDFLHKSEGTELFKIAARATGIDNNIIRMLCELLFLIMLHFSRESLELIIVKLSQVIVESDKKLIRVIGQAFKISLIQSGDFFEKWGDGRSYIRSMSVYGPCTCHVMRRCVTRDIMKESLSNKILDNTSCIINRKIDVYKYFFQIVTKKQFDLCRYDLGRCSRVIKEQ